MCRDVGFFRCLYTIVEYPIAWKISAHVNIVLECWQRGVAAVLCAMSGQGLGLAAQKAENSSAQSAGKITRLACRYPCDSPAVTVVWLPLRMLARTVSHGLACQRRVKNTALAGVTMHHRGGVYGGAKLVQVG